MAAMMSCHTHWWHAIGVAGVPRTGFLAGTGIPNGAFKEGAGPPVAPRQGGAGGEGEAGSRQAARFDQKGKSSVPLTCTCFTGKFTMYYNKVQLEGCPSLETHPATLDTPPNASRTTRADY